MYSKYYTPSECLAVDKVTVLFKEWVVFRQYIPNKHKCLGIKSYKLCDASGYSGKDRTYAVADVTAAHATAKQLIKKEEGHGHELYMDSFFSSTDLSNNLTKNVVGQSELTERKCHRT
jgi:hypothetical protein